MSKVLTEEDLFYLIALKCVPNIGNVKAKKILDSDIAPKNIFNLSIKELTQQFYLSTQDAQNIKTFQDFKLAETEMLFINKNKVSVCFYRQDVFPKYLQSTIECPFLFFYLGNLIPQTSKIVSIVGTRNNTDYGKKMTEKTIQEISHLDISIVSGLAKGIDTIAHEAALKHNLKTISILGHGLKTIYPEGNKKLAKNILENNGALMSEFLSHTTPSKETFPVRNRSVAAICDALIVIETKEKGGSMITANFANYYNKDVFAVPGKITDETSKGCNKLIFTHKAFLLNETKDLLEMMNWGTHQKQTKNIEQELFVSLNENQKNILNKLEKATDKIHLDVLITESNIPFSLLSSELLEMELKGLIKVLPGKHYARV